MDILNSHFSYLNTAMLVGASLFAVIALRRLHSWRKRSLRKRRRLVRDLAHRDAAIKANVGVPFCEQSSADLQAQYDLTAWIDVPKEVKAILFPSGPQPNTDGPFLSSLGSVSNSGSVLSHGDVFGLDDDGSGDFVPSSASDHARDVGEGDVFGSGYIGIGGVSAAHDHATGSDHY